MPASRLLLPSTALMGALAALLALPAHGQSLVDLYEAARGYDAAYLGATAQYQASLAKAAQSRAGILPSVGLSAGASSSQQQLSADGYTIRRGLPTQNAGINASQPLYRPANWASYKQGLRQADIAEATLVLAGQDLVLRVSQAYFDVLSSQDSLALVRQQKLGVAEQLASAKRNFEVGTTTITDTREAQARYDLVIAQEIAAENDLQVKKIALDQLVGRSGTQPVPLAAPVVLPTVKPDDMTAWVTQAEDSHPSIQQARLALEVAGLEVRKAEAGRLPTVDAQLGYNATNNPQGSTTSTSSGRVRVDAASIGVVLNMPLFAGFSIENRLKETLALEEQSRQQLEATRRNVSQATRTAYLGLLSGAGQVKALEAAEASSQSALDANRLGYQVGVRINIDVLNSQSQLFQTRRDLAVARYNVLVGNLKLRQANGSLSAEDLEAINDTLALGGRASVDSAASPTTPSAATQSPVPVPSNGVFAVEPRQPAPLNPLKPGPVLPPPVIVPPAPAAPR